jgi:hypothetical protein
MCSTTRSSEGVALNFSGVEMALQCGRGQPVEQPASRGEHSVAGKPRALPAVRTPMLLCVVKVDFGVLEEPPDASGDESFEASGCFSLP